MRGAGSVPEPAPRIWASPVLRRLPHLLMAREDLQYQRWGLWNSASPQLCVLPLTSLSPWAHPARKGFPPVMCPGCRLAPQPCLETRAFSSQLRFLSVNTYISVDTLSATPPLPALPSQRGWGTTRNMTLQWGSLGSSPVTSLLWVVEVSSIAEGASQGTFSRHGPRARGLRETPWQITRLGTSLKPRGSSGWTFTGTDRVHPLPESSSFPRDSSERCSSRGTEETPLFFFYFYDHMIAL